MKNLEAIPEKHSTDSLQKTAILGTSHTIRKVLQCETLRLSSGDRCWFKRSTGEKRLVTTDNNNNNDDDDDDVIITIIIIIIITAHSLPWSIHSIAENSIYMSYSSKVSGRTVNKKCLVSSPVLFENQLNCRKGTTAATTAATTATTINQFNS
jgi:hypothetical protein